MDKTVKKVSSTLGKFASAGAGLVGGSLVASKIPAFGPPIVQKIFPGLSVAILAYLGYSNAKNPYLKSASLGAGTAGVAKLINSLTAGREGVLATVNKATAMPSLGNYPVMTKQVMGVRGLGNVAQTSFDNHFERLVA